MSLPKLLSICCLVGIVFSAPTTSPSMGFKRELGLFKTEIQKEVCNASKCLSCRNQRVREIDFQLNCKPSHYQKIFCQVKNVSRELRPTMRNSTFSGIQISQELLGNSGNCSSLPPAQAYTSLDDFCSRVLKYVDYLHGTCP